MILVEEAQVAAAVLPIAGLRDQLRLGTGFDSDALQDGLLEACLRAALGLIEARTGQALLQRPYEWRLWAWTEPDVQPLPLGPVQSVISLETVDGDGVATAVDGTRYRLGPVAGVQALVARGAGLPDVPVDGHVRVRFSAGHGADWSAVPVDLRQAVLIQAARYYEHRSDAAGAADLAPAAGALIAPWLPMRLGARRGLA